MSEDRNNIVIVAPHPDDELISSFLILSDQRNSHISIIYSLDADNIRREEALKLKSRFNNVKTQHFCQSIPPIFLNPKTTFYFPDPTEAGHYEHRKWGAVGESMLRVGLDVIFYSINMKMPYCFEVKEWLKKKEALDEIYPSQKDLWSGGNAHYYMFEGRNKWLIHL